MMTLASTKAPVSTPPMSFAPERLVRPPRFERADQWLRSLGDIPLERILFDPWPGTATEADLLRYAERKESLCELIDGTLVEKAAGAWESQIAVELIAALVAFTKPRGLGLVFGADGSMRMIGGNVRLPGVGFVCTSRLPKTRDPVPSVSPDLAVEVLSPTNTQAEIARKLSEYFESDTRLAWIVDPKRREVAVHENANQPTRILDESRTLDGGDLLPGFRLAVADLFGSLPEGE